MTTLSINVFFDYVAPSISKYQFHHVGYVLWYEGATKATERFGTDYGSCIQFDIPQTLPKYIATNYINIQTFSVLFCPEKPDHVGSLKTSAFANCNTGISIS